MASLKKLPLGIQTFRQVIEDDCLYIDKTSEALALAQNYKYVFLSRPRRFGKSLFLDTLKNLFEGNQTLFEGLYVYDKWDWNQKYPVIKISWDGQLSTLENVEQKLKETLLDNQRRLQLECDSKIAPAICFERLIKEAYQKYQQKVVILIDEYDKPILDVIDNLEQAKLHREFIKGLYSVLKGVDEYIRFAFLTGVSKFSKASIFSGLNMLTDISLMPKFGNICGYTQKDLEVSFKDHLQGVDMQKAKTWYNGYHFLKDSLYNPFDILLFIANEHRFNNYWFSTGTPTFLIKLIQQKQYFLPKLSNLVVDSSLMDSFDIEDIQIEVLLYQAGYLTIESAHTTPFETLEYKLSLPNKEVKISLNDFIIKDLLKDATPNQNKTSLFLALKNADLEGIKTALVSIFASIPYNHYTNTPLQNYEGFYATVIYVYLQSLGIKVVGEDVTNRGRIDLTVLIEDKIYLIEFKIIQDQPDMQAENSALQQIKQKNYAQKYLHQTAHLYLVGIEFSRREKNIVRFDWDKISFHNDF